MSKHIMVFDTETTGLPIMTKKKTYINLSKI